MNHDDLESLFDLSELFPVAAAGISQTPLPSGPVLTRAERLCNYLHEVFPLRDERCKFAAAGRPFKIDDRNPSDRWEWAVSVEVLPELLDEKRISLVLCFDSIPSDEHLTKHLRDFGITYRLATEHATFEIPMQVRSAPKIRKLIPVIRRVAKERPKWQWLCKRVGDSLKRLADHLAEFQA